MIIDKANLANVAVKDADTGMGQVQFGPDGTWSTDGKLALFVRYPDIEREQVPSPFDPDTGDQEFTMSKKAVKAMELATKKPKEWKHTPRWGIALGAATDKEIQLHSLTDDGAFDWTMVRTHKTCPNVERAVPDVVDPKRTAFFSIPLLKSLLTAVEKAARGRGVEPEGMNARIYFSGNNKVVMLDLRCGIKGLIMPVTQPTSEPAKKAFDGPHSQGKVNTPKPYEGKTVQVHGPGTGKEGQPKDTQDMNWREKLKAGAK